MPILDNFGRTFKKQMPVFEGGPIREFVATWEPMVNRPKLFEQKMRYAKQALPLPEGITPTQAVAVIQNTSWAQDSAEGVVKKLGLTGPERDTAKQNWARALAQGMVSAMEGAPTSRKRGR